MTAIVPTATLAIAAGHQIEQSVNNLTPTTR
jgi:hypothetical protein